MSDRIDPQMSEPENMPRGPGTAVSICREDDGSIMAVFGAGVRAADLATAFASLPADARVAGIYTEWFSQEDDCEGQDLPDEGHCYPLVSVLLAPLELEEGAASWPTPMAAMCS